MSDPTDPPAPDDADMDTSDEPIASIPEGPLDAELHIGERLPDQDDEQE